jgi:hypothetical protein
VTFVVADAVLFAGFESVVGVTVALLVMLPAAVACATIVIVADPPASSVPTEHITVAVPEHVPCVEVAETKAVPAGKESVTATPFAVRGPRLLATIVYVMLEPTDPVAAADLVILKSVPRTCAETEAAAPAARIRMEARIKAAVFIGTYTVAQILTPNS